MLCHLVNVAKRARDQYYVALTTGLYWSYTLLFKLPVLMYSWFALYSHTSIHNCLHWTKSTVHYSSDHDWPDGFFLLIPPQSCGACWLAPGGRWWVRLFWDANLSDSPPLVRTLLMCPTLGPDGLEREGRKREEGRRARRRKGGQREDSEENKVWGR